MWRKPAELAKWSANGFEIAIGQPGVSQGLKLDSNRSIEIWKRSSAHNDVILNRGTWANQTWRAMGAGIIDSHAAVWFAAQTDPATGGS